MVGIVAGQGLGLFNTSLGLLGSQGVLGSAGQGRSGEKVYVNASNGNLVVQQQDEWLVGVGPDAGILRTYNSQGGGTDDNGDNWRLGLSRRVIWNTGSINQVGSSVKRVGEDGAEAIYTWDVGQSKYVNKDGSGSFDTLSYITGTWVWVDGSTQLKEWYSVTSGLDANLTRVLTPDGNNLDVIYESGRITQIDTWSATAATGEKVKIDYDTTAGNTNDIKSITTTYLTGEGAQLDVKRVSYTYETYNTNQRRLTKVTVDLTPQNAADNAVVGKTYSTTYAYVDGTSKRLASIIQSDNSKLAFTYDPANNLKIASIKETIAGESTPRETKFTYGAGYTQVTDALGQVTELGFETGAGQKQYQLNRIKSPAIGGQAQEQFLTYDEHGNVSTVTDARANTTTYKYDANGNRTYERDAQNNVVERTFDVVSNALLTETVYTGVDPDGGGAASPTGGLTTRYAYDAKNHLRFTISAEGLVTEHQYNYPLGQRTSTLQYSASKYDVTALSASTSLSEAQVSWWAEGQAKGSLLRTDFIYDSRGQLDKLTTYARVDVNGLGVTADGTQSVTQYVYDQAGNLLSKVDGRLNRISYAYDGLNRITTYTDANDVATETSYLDAERTTKVTLVNGLVSTSVYDEAGSLLSVSRADGTTALGITTYQYDKLARLIAQTLPTGEKSYFIYDEVGRKVGEIDGEGALTEYQYNANNQLTRTLKYASKVSSTMLNAIVPGVAGMPVNLISNAVAGWVMKSSNGSATGISATSITGAAGGSTLLGEVSRLVVQPVNSLATTLSLSSGLTAVTVGKRYDVSAYVGVTNASATLTVEYYNAAGSLLGSSAVLGTNTGTHAGGLNLSDYRRLQGFLTIPPTPAGIVQIKLVVTKSTATNTTLASRFVVARPVLSEVTASQATPTITDLRPLVSTMDRRDLMIYDQAGRLSKTVKVTVDGIGTTAAVGSVVEYRYDAANRLVDKVHYARFLTASQTSSLLAFGANVWGTDGAITVNGTTIILPIDVDADRHTRTFYNKDGRVLGLLDSENYYTAYGYDTAGRLVRTSRFAKAAQGTLLDAKTPPQIISPSATPPATAYVFMSSGGDQHSYQIYNVRGQVSADIDPEGYVTAYSYDAAGNKTKQIRYYNRSTSLNSAGYISLGSITTQTGAQVARYVAVREKDQSTVFGYDDNNRLRRTESQPQGVVSEYLYDDMGNLLKRTTALGGGDDERVTQQRYDKLGRITQELSGEGSKALAALGETPEAADVEAVWNQYGMRHEYDQGGHRVATIVANGFDGTGLKTAYYYDQAGRLTHSINALGEITSLNYNAFGDVTEERSHAARLSNLSAVSGGLKSAMSAAVSTAVAATIRNGEDSVRFTSYNRAGQVSWTREQTSLTPTYFAYNAFGERKETYTRSADDEDRISVISYDRRGLITAMADQNSVGVQQRIVGQQYDAFGRVVIATDANGVQRERSFDKLGRVISEVEPGGALLIRTMAYDSFSRLIHFFDQESNLTQYVFDDAARTMKVTTPEGIITSTKSNAHGQAVEVKDGRGNLTKYTYNKDGQVTSSSVTEAATNSVLTGTSTSTEYDKAGRVWTTTDARGNVTRTAYDAANRVLTRVQDETNLKLTSEYRYDAQGRAVWSRDPAGVWTQTEFDQRGRVTAVTVDPAQVPDASASAGNVFGLMANSSGANALKQRTEFVYNMDSSVLRVIKAAGSPRPEITEYWYDLLGRRVAEVSDPDGLMLKTTYVYDANDNVVARKDGFEQVTRYVYNARNQVVLSVDATGAVVRNDYSDRGQLSRVTAYAQRIDLSNLADQVTQADIQARLPATVQTNDQITYNFYDLDGHLSKTMDALGYVTERVYDASGNVARITRYANKAVNIDVVGYAEDGTLTFGTPIVSATVIDGIPTVVTDADKDQVEQFVYDGANRQTWQIDALGYATKTTYSLNGRWLMTTRYANKVVHPSGQSLLEVNSAPLVLTVAPSNITQSYVLQIDANDRESHELTDVLGRSTTTLDAANFFTSRTYDAAGRLKQVIRFGTAGSINETDPTNSKTTYDYDAAGRNTKVTDAEGVITFKQFDLANRLTDSTQAYGTSDASTTHYVYDEAGRVKEETQAYGKAEQATTRYVLNALGQREQIIDPRGVELAEGTSQWAHAERLRILGFGSAPAADSDSYKKLLAAYTTMQVFDAAGRIMATMSPLGNITSIDYDAFGNEVAVIDPRGNSGYFYFNQRNEQVFQIDPLGYAVQTERDGFGNAVHITRYYTPVQGPLSADAKPVIIDVAPTPEAPRTDTYQVRSAGLGSGIGVVYGGDAVTHIEYDALNRQVVITDAKQQVESMVYDNAFGEKTSAVNKAGGVTIMDYDKRGNLVSATLPEQSALLDEDGNTSMLRTVQTRYEYDARGNRTQEIEAFGLAEQRTTVFVYDKSDRLLSTQGQAMQTYTVSGGSVTGVPLEARRYDLRGNLVEVKDASGARTLAWFDALNRKVAELKAVETDPSGVQRGSLSTFEYNSGDMIRQRLWGQSVTLPAAWSTTPVATPTTTDVRDTWFTYDASHRLTQTLIKGVVVGGIDIVAGNFQLDAQDLIKTTQYDANGNAVVETDARGNKTYYYYDAVGNRVAMVDAGRFATFWFYDASGNVTAEIKTARQIPASFDIKPDSDIQSLAGLSATWVDRGTFQYRNTLGQVIASTVLSSAVINLAENKYEAAAPDSYPVTRYEYNELGQVTKQTENTGEISERIYDKQGREISKLGATFTDFEEDNVRTRVDTQYNALGDVLRTVQRGKVSGSEADDRITIYRYGTNGLLSSTIDAGGAVTAFDYDLAGHLTRTSTARLEGTDSLSLSANKQLGRMYLERLTRPIQGHASKFVTSTSTVQFDVGTVFSTEVSLGHNGASRLFKVGLQQGTAGTYNHRAVFSGDTLTAEVVAQVTPQAASNSFALKNDTTYLVEIRITKNASGQFVSTLYVYEKGKAFDSGFVDARTLGTVAWTDVRGAITNLAKLNFVNSAGAGVLDSINKLSVRDALGLSKVADFSDWKAVESSLSVTSGTIKSLTVFDERGRSKLSVDDVEEYDFDAAGREVRRHNYTSKSGLHLSADVSTSGTLVVGRYAPVAPLWTEINGLQSTAWGNGTNYYAEVRTGVEGANREFMLGIQNGNTGQGITAPANISRHDAYFKGLNLTFSYAENGVWLDNPVTTYTLEANTTYVVEVKVEKNVAGETWSTAYVYKKGVASPVWTDARKVTTLWTKAQMHIANFTKSTAGNTPGYRDHIDHLKLSDAQGKIINEDFSYRGAVLDRLASDEGTNSASLWVQDAIGAASAMGSTTTEVRYNAYGEVAAKGKEGVWQESSQYDGAGRATRAVGSDGVPRIYVYDANGNLTLTLSPPADGETLDVVKQIFLGVDPITSGDIKTLLNKSSRVLISAYDARNQVSDTFEASASMLFASTNQVSATVGSVVAEEVKNYPSVASVGTGKSVSVQFDYSSDFYGDWVGGGSDNDRSVKSINDTFKIRILRSGAVGQKYVIRLHVDDGHTSTSDGRGYIRGTDQVFELTETAGEGLQEKPIYFQRYATGDYWSDCGGVRGAGFTVTVSKVTGTITNPQEEVVTTMGGSLSGLDLPPRGWLTQHVVIAASGAIDTPNLNALIFSSLPLNGGTASTRTIRLQGLRLVMTGNAATPRAYAVLQYRMADQSPAAWHTSKVEIVKGKAVFGEDVLRAMGSTVVGTAEKPMEFVLNVLDDGGRVVSVQSGQVGVNRDAGAANYYFGKVSKAIANVEDRTGRVFTTAEGVNFVSAAVTDPANKTPAANSALVRFRKVGESAWTTGQVINAAPVAGAVTRGWFVFNPPMPFSAGTTFEYIIELKTDADGQGATLDTLDGYIKAAGGNVTGGAYQVYDGAPPVKADRSASIVRFQSVPAATVTATVTYKLTKRVWTDGMGAPLAQGRLVVESQGTVPVSKDAHGQYVWDAAVVGLDPTLQYTLDYTFEAKDGAGATLSTMTSRDVLRTGSTKPMFNAVIYSPSADSTQLYRISGATLKLTHSADIAAQVRKVVISYRLAGSASAYTEKVIIPVVNPQGVVNDVTFDLSQTSLMSASADFTDFDVFYRYEDSVGKVLLGYSVVNQEDVGAPTQFSPILVRAMADAAFNDGSSNASTALWGFINAPTTSRRMQSHNAFGEVKWELTANNFEFLRKYQLSIGRVLAGAEFLALTTQSYYDGMGRLIYKIDPLALATLENGASGAINTITKYTYDSLGRLKEIRDALGNVTKYVLMATGDGRRLLNAELRPIGTNHYYAYINGYDIFGDLRYKGTPLPDGSNFTKTDYFYDKMGRILRVDMPEGNAGNRATHLYRYDSKGNRVLHSTSPTNAIDANGWLGAQALREYTLFDMMGRVRKTISGEGLITLTDFAVAAGGQSTKVYTDENGKKIRDWLDYAGRVVRHVDMSNKIFSYVYNLAGNLTAQYQVDLNNAQIAGEQHITYSYWADGTLKQINDLALDAISYYTYDKDGNRTLETYTVAGADLQAATITYDAKGRISSVIDSDHFVLGFQYDVLGNRRRVWSQKIGTTTGSVDYWYTYDQENRMLISMGSLVGGLGAAGSITQNGTARGVKLTYDFAGNRESALYSGQTDAEVYSYTADGYLTKVTKGVDLLSERTNDLLGRVTSYMQTNTDGVVSWTTTDTRLYDKDSRTVYIKNASTKSGAATLETWNSHNYFTTGVLSNGSAYFLPSTKTNLLIYSKTVATPAAGAATTTYTRYDYTYRDSAMQSGIRTNSSNPDVSEDWGTWASGVSQFTYNVNGHLASVKDSMDGGDVNVRTITFTNNANGLVLERRESGPFTYTPFQNYFYVDGRRMAEWSNAEIPNNLSYAEALMVPPSNDVNPRDRYRNLGPIRSNIDQNYTPISASYPAFTPGGYTVRTGDTLESIARSVWGDATMWYLIAEANGLMSNANLRVGQTLVIPNKVTNFHNNGQTTRVYNPGEVMGDVSPTTPDAPVAPPPPSPDEGCGVLGAILMIVVAVVVTIYTAGAAASVLGAATGGATTTFGAGLAIMGGTAGITGATIAAAAIGGAVGSIASQLVGMATGNVQEFSWSAVALSAIGAGVGVGMGGALTPTNNAYIDAALSSARNNVVTQGASMVLGLQKKFDWRSVAAAAVGGSIGRAMTYSGDNRIPADSWGGFGSRVTSGILSGAATAAIYKQKPDWSSIAVNSFGSALGDAVVGSIARGDSAKNNQPPSAAQMRALEAGLGPVNGRVADALAADIDAQIRGTDLRSYFSGSGEVSPGSLPTRNGVPYIEINGTSTTPEQQMTLAAGYGPLTQQAALDTMARERGDVSYSAGVSEVREFSAVDEFFGFSALGRGLSGYANAAADIVSSPVTLAQGLGNIASDAYGYGHQAIFGVERGVFGDERPYQAQSSLVRSVQDRGVLGTVGATIVGGVKSIPPVAVVDALYRRDPTAIGASLANVSAAMIGGRSVNGSVANKGFRVDSTMFAADEAAGVLKNGSYIKNPTAQNLSGLVTDSGRIGGKNMNGQYMYVVDQEGSIIVGTRSGQRMPHPTLVGGENPQVLGAGIVDIRGGKIYSVDNASGHFKPGSGSLEAAQDAFSKLPSKVFHKDFQGYLPYGAGGGL